MEEEAGNEPMRAGFQPREEKVVPRVLLYMAYHRVRARLARAGLCRSGMRCKTFRPSEHRMQPFCPVGLPARPAS